MGRWMHRIARKRLEERDEAKEEITNLKMLLREQQVMMERKDDFIKHLKEEIEELKKPDWKTYCKECGKKGIPMNLERHVTCEFCGTKFEYVPLKEIVSELEKRVEALENINKSQPKL